METRICSKCAGSIPRDLKQCPLCGFSNKRNKKSFYKRWWFIVIFALVGLYILNGLLSTRYQKKELALQKELTPLEYINEARKAYAERKADVAILHLLAIEPGVPEYLEAQKLLKRLIEIESGKQTHNKKLMQEYREKLADEIERNFLSQGMDVYIHLSGSKKTVIKLEYVLFSRPLIYKIANETNFLQNLREAGFKKVIFNDKYKTSLTYNLEN